MSALILIAMSLVPFPVIDVTRRLRALYVSVEKSTQHGLLDPDPEVVLDPDLTSNLATGFRILNL